jgi:hypothetical protein
MASFFKSILFSQQVEIDDSDSESELDDDNFDKDFIDKLNIDLNIYDKFTKYLLIKYFNPDNLIDKNRKYLTFKMDLNCVKYFNKLSINRKLNNLHWSKIKKSFINELNDNDNELVLSWPIVVGLFDNSFFIFDGQHRIQAINSIRKERDIYGNIQVHLYIPDNYNDILEIISDINSTKPLDVYDYLSNNIIHLIAHLKDYFVSSDGKNILTTNKARRPFINEYTLRNKLEEKDFIKSYNYSKIKDIYMMIQDINEKYKEYDIGKLKFENKNKLTTHMIKIANKYNCYLGFDSNYEWIDIIEKKLLEKFNKNNKKINSEMLNKIDDNIIDII